MQATVARFDDERHHGEVLLDNGSMLDFPATAFAASGLRRLSVGQRVRVERADAGEIVLVTLVTMGTNE